MRRSNHVAGGIPAFALMIIVCLTPASGQRGFLGSSYYFVANTRPPDAFLVLRTHPSWQAGLRIMTMPNGTLLEVLERREDGWWYVESSPRVSKVGHSAVRVTACGLSVVERD
jgi:hypothetical protein